MNTRWSTRDAHINDAAWMLELRNTVLRPHLEKLGRWNPERARERFLGGYRPENTRVILVDGSAVGLIAVRVEADAVWIENFYLDAAIQGQGIGGEILRSVLAQPHGGLPFRLNVLQQSAAARLYERHGFSVESFDEVDIFMIAAPATP